MLPELSTEDLLQMLRSIIRVRRFEESLISLATEIDVGHFHVYVGQETTGVPAISLLRQGDMGFTTHRNHGHLLARGVDPAKMFAEILGKATGTNRGKGGTLHLASADYGFPATSSATGGCIPLATGAAFGFSRLDSGNVSVCLMGDGALEEGAWHESINIASLESLPVVYLCENNSLEALGQKANEYPSSTMAAHPLTDLAEVFKVPVTAIDGTDVKIVYETMAAAVERARAGDGPTFIEARTVRWPGSRPLWPQLVTGETDIAMAWEPELIPDAHRDWFDINDGLIKFVRALVDSNQAAKEELLDMDREVRNEMEVAVQFALDSPYPAPEAALDGVFV